MTVPIDTISGVNTVADVRYWSGSLVASGLAGVPVVDVGYSVGQGVTNQDGFAQSGTTTSVQFDSTAGTTDGLYVGRSVTLTANTGAGQASVIVGYSGGAMKIATVAPPFVTAPLSGTAYVWGEPVGSARVASGALSGQPTTAASGLFVTVPIATISGVTANSGLFVNATATVGSGLFVTVPIASISGVVTASGGFVNATAAVNSGLFVTASLNSGQQVLIYSGQTAVDIPRGILTYDYSGAPNESGQRNLLNATRKLINKWSLTDVSGYLRVYAEDDATAAYDQAFTSVSGGQPISSLDTK